MLRFCAVLATLLFPLATSIATAQGLVRTPTVQELVASIPRLSPHNPEIQNMRFTLEAWLSDESKYPLRCDVQWSRDQPGGMLMSSSPWQTPTLFISQNRGLYFQIASHKITHLKDTQPRLVLRRSEDSINFKFGNKSTDSSLGIEIDLASLVNLRAGRPAVEIDANGNWVVKTISSTGGGDVTIVFDRNPPHTLRTFELRSLSTGSRQFLLHNVSINDKTLPPWPLMPDDNVFPKNFVVQKEALSKEDEKNVKAVMDATIEYTLSMAIQFGTEISSMRENELLKQVDWNAIEKSHKESGPVLRQALGFSPIVDDRFPNMRR